MRLINLGPNALFSNYKLTTSSGKHLENIDHAHIVSLMYKLLSSSRDSDDLSIGFDRSRDKRKREMLNNKTQKFLLQEKHAGNNSDMFNEEIVAIVDNILEYKCISK